MRTLGLIVVGETGVFTTNAFPDQHPDAWLAMLDWCKVHGLDPEAMPCTNMIVRNVERCRIEYTEFVGGADRAQWLFRRGGDEPEVRRVHAQGETPPAPFPPEVLAVQP